MKSFQQDENPYFIIELWSLGCYTGVYYFAGCLTLYVGGCIGWVHYGLVEYNCTSQLYVHKTILNYFLGINSYKNEILVSCCFIGWGLHLCCFFAGKVLPPHSLTLLCNEILHIY